MEPREQNWNAPQQVTDFPGGVVKLGVISRPTPRTPPRGSQSSMRLPLAGVSRWGFEPALAKGHKQPEVIREPYTTVPLFTLSEASEFHVATPHRVPCGTGTEPRGLVADEARI